jgi:hypothetical protein
MGYVVCPNCGGNLVVRARSRLFIVLGSLVLVSCVLAYCVTFCCPMDDNWSGFMPLCHIDPAMPVALVFGLLLIWGGVSQAHKAICLKCGYEWERRDHPLNRYRHSPRPPR